MKFLIVFSIQFQKIEEINNENEPLRNQKYLIVVSNTIILFCLSNPFQCYNRKLFIQRHKQSNEILSPVHAVHQQSMQVTIKLSVSTLIFSFVESFFIQKISKSSTIPTADNDQNKRISQHNYLVNAKWSNFTLNTIGTRSFRSSLS